MRILPMLMMLCLGVPVLADATSGPSQGTPIPIQQPSLGAAGMKSSETSNTTQPVVLQPDKSDPTGLFPRFSKGDTGPDEELPILIPGKMPIVTKRQIGQIAAQQVAAAVPATQKAESIAAAAFQTTPMPMAAPAAGDAGTIMRPVGEALPEAPAGYWYWLLPTLLAVAFVVVSWVIVTTWRRKTTF